MVVQEIGPLANKKIQIPAKKQLINHLKVSFKYQNVSSGLK